MRFGIFDHLDDSGLPLSQHFEQRLRLIEMLVERQTAVVKMVEYPKAHTYPSPLNRRRKPA